MHIWVFIFQLEKTWNNDLEHHRFPFKSRRELAQLWCAEAWLGLISRHFLNLIASLHLFDQAHSKHYRNCNTRPQNRDEFLLQLI